MFVPTILLIIFSISACLESASYGLYEIYSNNNKVGGIILIILSAIALFVPIIVYSMK